MLSLPSAPATRAAAPATRGRLERVEPLALPAVALVVALGVAMRLWSTSPLWLDEAQTVQFARLPLGNLHQALKTDGAPPLYYVLLHGWLSMLHNLGLDGAWAARSLSMLFSLAALPLAYLAGLRLGGSRRHGQIALVLFAANPWSVRYGGEARMYSLVVLLVLLGVLALDWMRQRPGPLPAVALAAVTTALLYTHYWAIFLLVTVGAVLLFRTWRDPESRRSTRLALIALAGGGLVFLPWVPTMLYQSAHTGAPWAARPDLGSIAALPADWSGGEGPVGRTLGLLIVPLALLAVFARRRPGSSVVVIGARPEGVPARLAVIVVGTLLLALGVCMATGGAVVGRYTAVVVPLVLLLVAFGIRTLPPAAGLGVTTAVVVIGLIGSRTIATTPHTQAGGIAAVINAQGKDGDLVVYCPDQLAPAVEAQLTVVGLETLTLPSEPNPAVIDWTDYKARIAALKPKVLADGIADYSRSVPNATIWFVSGAGYRTHAQICGALHNRLVVELGMPGQVAMRDGRGYEKAALERFPR